MKYTILLLMTAFMIYSCSRYNQKISETKVLEVTENIEEDVIFNMGILKSGEQTVLELKLINTLQKPFVINDVIRFCGCTTPEYATTPILPQKSSVIKFTFVADHVGLFSKAVKIYLDTQKKPVQVLFRGEIVGKTKSSNLHSNSSQSF